jgi:rhodanese-related sulfurtransferase
MNHLPEFLANHPLLVAATVLAALAVLAFELRLRRRAGTEISITEAVRMINNGATVVDVRERAAYDAGHIADAIHMPAAELRAGGEGRFNKKKRGVLVVCDTGTVSHGCAEALRKAGLEGAFSLRGGIAAWQRENQPLVASKVRA